MASSRFCSPPGRMNGGRGSSFSVSLPSLLRSSLRSTSAAAVISSLDNSPFRSLSSSMRIGCPGRPTRRTKAWPALGGSPQQTPAPITNSPLNPMPRIACFIPIPFSQWQGADGLDPASNPHSKPNTGRGAKFRSAGRQSGVGRASRNSTRELLHHIALFGHCLGRVDWAAQNGRIKVNHEGGE